MSKKKLKPVDREALDHALRTVIEEDPYVHGHSAEERLRRGDWLRAAEGAVYHLQMKNLKLKPWQIPPAWAYLAHADLPDNPHGNGEEKAARLAKRLLAAGLSIYEPDPERALAEKAGKAAAAGK